MFKKQMRHSFKWSPVLVVIFICSLVLTQRAYAQVTDVQLDLNETTPEASATITIPDGVIEILRLTAYDPDFPDEGQLFINEQGPIGLFPGGNGGNDGLSVNIDIRLTDAQKAWFVAGDNVLRFQHLATAGFQIERITVIGDVQLAEFPEITPSMAGGDIAPERDKALKIYKRLVGVTTPIDNPKLDEIEAAVAAGDLQQAAEIASTEPGFLNYVVKDFAAKMSNRDETVKVSLNDFIASFIGVVRDESDARTLLTGNFYYQAANNTPVPNNLVEDILSSNEHYQTLEEDGYDIGSVLTRVDNQSLRASGGVSAPNPDPAGVITSRAFMEAHATAGTNRRLVEYMMKAFTCNIIENWSDTTSPDIRVGRDVERYPGGDGAKFQTTCKACHGNMDGMRGAFARYDFSDGFVKYAPLLNNAGGADGVRQSPIGIVRKMNQNSDVFPIGHMTVDDSWVNYAVSPANQTLLGWRGDVTRGAGVGQLAQAVANSSAFSKCMVKRVFREVCRRDPVDFEQDMVDSSAALFESQGYNLKKLFQTIAVRPECLGQ